MTAIDAIGAPSARRNLPAATAAKVAASEEEIASFVSAHGAGATLLCSGQDAVMVDLVLGVAPKLEVTFIDTGYHFPETIETMLSIVERYRPKLRVVNPWRHLTGVGKPGFCCSDHKVEQLDLALEGRTAWMSGIRRADGEARADASLRETDRRGLAKLNPIVDWDDDDVVAFEVSQDIIINPLRAKGYPSIGCKPCTSPSTNGRDGRWAGSGKSECGIHL